MKPEFDGKDQTILDRRRASFDLVPGPRVGDFVRLLDGTLRRFTYRWAGLQTTMGSNGFGPESFYLDEAGASYSGGLDTTIPLPNLVPTEETQWGEFWFFHHDLACAHNGVNFTFPCRVYREVRYPGKSK
jgi:hypothetical protein